MTDRIVPEDERHDEAKDDQPNYTPFVKRKRIWSVPQVVLMGIGIVGLLAGLYVVLVDKHASEGPTLESRVQQQQHDIAQLRTQLDELQSNQGAIASTRQEMKGRLDSLADRMDEQEHYRAAPERQSLPGDVEALSKRLEKLSSSVDVRFSAAQEKEQALENAIAKVRERQESAKKAAKPNASQPPAEQAPTPPFTITGLELRGGRPYVGVLKRSGGAGRLSDIQLVAEGQRVGEWRLSGISDHSATFAVNGQSVAVLIP